MLVFVISLILIVSILLVLVILAQNPKGGLSSQFGGSGTSNLIGVKKTGDLLENITWSLGIGLFILTLSINFLTENLSEQYVSPNIERAQEQLILPEIDLEGTDAPDTESTDNDQGSETIDGLDQLKDPNQ